MPRFGLQYSQSVLYKSLKEFSALFHDFCGSTRSFRDHSQNVRDLLFLLVTFKRSLLENGLVSGQESGYYYFPSTDRVLELINEEINHYPREISEKMDRIRSFMSDNVSSVDELNPYLKEAHKYYEMLGRDKTSAYFCQPAQLTALVNAIVNCKPGETVYNPFAGMGSYGLHLDRSTRYFGQEEDDSVRQLAILYADLYFEEELNIERGNSLTEWRDGRYDYIVSTPPFRLKINELRGDYLRNPYDYDTIEGWLLEKSFSCLTEKGVMVCVVPIGFLSSGGKEKNLRQRLVEANMIDEVILLPPNIFNGTGVQTAVLVIKKSKHLESTAFIDATSCYRREGNKRVLDFSDDPYLIHPDQYEVTRPIYDISADEIAANDYNLNPLLYESQPVLSKDFMRVKLEEIARLSLLNSSDYFDISSYCNPQGCDGLSYKVEPRPIDVIAEDSTEMVACLINSPTLMIDLLNPKVIFVKASEDHPEWFSTGRWVKCELDTSKVDQDYFAYCFGNIPAKKFEAFKIGSAGRRLSISTLRSLPLDILQNVEDQRKVVEEAKRVALNSQAKSLGLEHLLQEKDEEIARMKADYIGEVRNRKHDMRTPMAQIRSTYKLLEAMISNLPDSESAKLATYVERIKVAHSKLSLIVDHIADEDVFSPPEILDIETIIKSFLEKTDNYVIEYFRDDAALREAGIDVPKVLIGRSDFQRLVQNIVSNAIDHGFKGNRGDYALNISLSIDDKFFVIDFSNNGNPLPEGMDKSRYGQRGVKGKDSKGTGSGGYIVKSITQHYGGDYDISSTQFAGMSFTNVIVKLPIYFDEDEQIQDSLD